MNMKKYFYQISKALSVLFLLSFNSLAISEGLNSENFLPSADNESGILWETTNTVPRRALGLGYTFDYSLHPLEFGDGKSERIPISDHLQVNHFGISYGLFNWLQIGADIPLALYSAPSSVDGYLPTVKNRGRNFFFFGDFALQGKFSLLPFLKNDPYSVAILASAILPTGSRQAMLTDDALKLSLEIITQFKFNSFEIFFTPGISMWANSTRVIATPTGTGRTKDLLTKANSLLLSFGARSWLIGSSETMKPGTLFADLGLRGDFKDFVPTLNNPASPVEWSVGGGYVLLPDFSLHGGLGSGIGNGVGAPLTRVVAGIRYTIVPETQQAEDDKLDTLLTSSSYTDQEFEQIVRQAQSEPVPPRIGEDESYLRLKYNGNIVDIGRIRFEFNSAALSSQALETVQRLYEELKRQNATNIKIEGHTDSIGSFNYNLSLSKRRAESVKNALIKLNIDASIIRTDGMSYKYPMASNATKEGRSQNRRIEVSLDGESFRKAQLTTEDEKQMREWISPGGKKPVSNR